MCHSSDFKIPFIPIEYDTYISYYIDNSFISKGSLYLYGKCNILTECYNYCTSQIHKGYYTVIHVQVYFLKSYTHAHTIDKVSKLSRLSSESDQKLAVAVISALL